MRRYIVDIFFPRETNDSKCVYGASAYNAVAALAQQILSRRIISSVPAKDNQIY